MKKVLLIIQREYMTRVKKKSFIVLTILVPLMFIGMIALIGYIVAKGDDLGDKKKIEVVDESGRFAAIKGSSMVEYTVTKKDYASTKNTFIKDGYDYLLYIPASLEGVQILGEKKAGPLTADKIGETLTGMIRTQRLVEAGIDTAMLNRAQKQVSVEDVKESNAQEAMVLGIASAMLIYISLLVYGTQVMRGVIEEKVSRIIEVMISSVKPFQLMLGKIIGVGMVGMTQFVLWIVISLVLSTGLGAVMASHMAPAVQAVQQGAAAAPAKDNILADLMTLPITEIVCCFLFYFFGGYLLYSALFAAVGSAVDNETETQQFVFPVTMPLIFTFALSQSFIINNPDSSLAVWLSMIPFTSPIAMMIRIPFGVPPAQIALSMVLMVLGFLLTTWVAGRIYRVGVLMYGKKASYKELAKWFMYKE